MPKAELEDGTIVALEKDCGCTDHEGPHWLHMDALVKDINSGYPRGGGFLACAGFAQAEEARLNSKLHEMRQRKIKRLIYE